MKTHTLIKTDASELANLQQEYLGGLSRPIDGMWNSFVGMADHYKIEENGETKGYCVINADHQLLQFHVPHSNDSSAIFTQIIKDLKVTGAVVSTGDTPFLSLCMDNQKSVSINALLFQTNTATEMGEVTFPDGAEFRLVAMTELENVVDNGVETLGADRGWLTGYWTHHINREELFGLWLGDKIIGTGERRVSDSQKPFADVGMAVAKAHRQQGIATNILRQLHLICREEGRRAICSAVEENIPSQKAIKNAGFISQDRILEIEFK